MTHPFRKLSAQAPVGAAPVLAEAEAAQAGAADADAAARASAEEAARAAARAEEEAREGLRRQAEAAGYEDGLKRGRAEACAAIEAALPPAVAALEEARARLEAAAETDRRAMAEAAITLGKTLAETLVGAPRPFDRDALLADILREAAEGTGPGDLSLICRAAPTTLAEIGDTLPASVAPKSDTTMKPGGFVVELHDPGAGGMVNRWDASVERMEAAIRALGTDV